MRLVRNNCVNYKFKECRNDKRAAKAIEKSSVTVVVYA